jgi:hypothetical protein
MYIVKKYWSYIFPKVIYFSEFHNGLPFACSSGLTWVRVTTRNAYILYDARFDTFDIISFKVFDRSTTIDCNGYISHDRSREMIDYDGHIIEIISGHRSYLENPRSLEYVLRMISIVFMKLGL